MVAGLPFEGREDFAMLRLHLYSRQCGWRHCVPKPGREGASLGVERDCLSRTRKPGPCTVCNAESTQLRRNGTKRFKPTDSEESPTYLFRDCSYLLELATMSIRPRGLADCSANRDPSEDRYVRETVALPRDEAC